jgi:hypothetical protein
LGTGNDSSWQPPKQTKVTRPLLANPGIDIEAKDDFAFVPEKDTASKKAASDLRSAFGDF